MVVGAPDHTIQADIIFVIEGTAINGAYLNEMKTTYVVPTLEYFSQGTIEDYVCESTSTLYGIVTYQAADCLPCPSSDSFGPYTSPQKVIHMFDKIELIGGKGESHANVAEGLATALQCFEDLQQKREANSMPQKHCILICNSPPYLLPVMESQAFSGHTVDQLAAIISERGINLSVLSPRKIPALFKLYEKAGGDLQASQTKNYAKDPRHLVLLKGYSLKERPISPGPGPPQHPNTLPLPSLSSPLPSTGTGSPMSVASAQATQAIMTPPQAQQTIFRPNQPSAQAIALANQQQAQQQAQQAQQAQQVQQQQTQQTQQQQQQQQQLLAGRGPTSYPQQGPPSYHPTMLQGNRTPGRWPMMPPQPRPPYSSNVQGSALIAQLTQPPSVTIGSFGNNAVLNQNPNNVTQQQQQQQQVQQAQQQVQQAQQQVQQQQQQVQQAQQQVQQQAALRMIGQQNAGLMAQQSPGGAGQQVPPPGQPGQPQTGRERHTIWQGVLEWIEKAKIPSDTQKMTRHVPCQVSANSKDGEPELKADSWPPKLIMQLMPKQLIGNIGGAYLKNSKSVLFHPSPCEALESLTKVMSTGFAGCVHFTSIPSPSACDIKVLILLYTAEKRAYLGFIPNDQAAFVDRLRKVIQHQKSTQAMLRQGQAVTQGQQGTGPMGAPGGPLGGTQQAGQMGSLMQGGPLGGQQGATQAGSGGSNASQTGGAAGSLMQAIAGQRQAQNPQQTAVATSQANNGLQGADQRGTMGQRPPFNQHIEAARQENLAKIQQLRQTLEAAQQQELQFKSQIEMYNHMKIQQLQQTLEQAQQQENHFQAQMEQEQQKHLRAQLQQMRQIAPQKPGTSPQQPMTNPQQQQQQRMMRPGISNNPGLRHLLQQPQYRQQVLGMQQQLPRTQQGNPQQPTQQFDDVTSFDFLN